MITPFCATGEVVPLIIGWRTISGSSSSSGSVPSSVATQPVVAHPMMDTSAHIRFMILPFVLV